MSHLNSEKMRIESTAARGNFRLLTNGRSNAELKYDNWYSGKAHTVGGHSIEIKPANFWATKFDIRINGKPAGMITGKFNGHFQVDLSQSEQGIYLLKLKSAWRLKFSIYNESGALQFQLISKNNWKKLNYDYEVIMENFDGNTDLKNLLIICGYVANRYLTNMGAV